MPIDGARTGSKIEVSFADREVVAESCLARTHSFHPFSGVCIRYLHLFCRYFAPTRRVMP